MSLVTVLLLVVLAAGVGAWATGAVGRRRVLTEQEASSALKRVLGEKTAEASMLAPDDALASARRQGLALDPGPSPEDGTGGEDSFGASFADGAIPAAIAGAVGIAQWLTPDNAALKALEHVTGREVSNALDFHSVVAGKALDGEGYRLLSDGSASNWMGHLGEQQIREQVADWAQSGSVEMPQSASFEGADLTLFGRDYQVKFYDDFNDIVNRHGDPLIVNEDAVNLPEDALRVDFSEQFDPAILEGHDVIVAVGLSQAGALDAWESAVGPWAGGLDAGDVVGEALEAGIPGLGAAVAVAVQGYRRRRALMDETLREEASKRIVRDSGERLVAVTGGATAGTLIGALVDMGSLGLTMGGGALVGGIVGSWFAGRKAAQIAQGRDASAIQRAQQSVIDSTAAYGRALETARSAAQADWEAARSDAERSAMELAEWHVRRTREFADAASASLDMALCMSPEVAANLLHQSRLAMRNLRACGWGLPALRQRHAWLSRASAASGEHTTDEILLLAVAVPGGEDRVRLWLQAAHQRRQVVIVSAQAALAGVRRSAFQARAELRARLAQKREQLDHAVASSLVEPIGAVESASEELRRELVLAGRAV